jgi:hypothetical protein
VPCSARLLLLLLVLLRLFCVASCLSRCWNHLLLLLILQGAQLPGRLVQVAPQARLLLLASAQLLVQLPCQARASLAASSIWQLFLLAQPPLRLRRLWRDALVLLRPLLRCCRSASRSSWAGVSGAAAAASCMLGCRLGCHAARRSPVEPRL